MADSKGTPGPDLMNRDPNNINIHLEYNFEDVLAEPDGTHSIDCVWKLSFTCCEFAYISFVPIWCFTPFFRMLDLNCGCMKRMYGMCIKCCLEPCCEAAGLIFHVFKK
ncbi:hypothetical protein ACJMK2_016425 [Sinanodonta woodiana]|uniref:Caveolin n=1 Tax=Sinanodonta woodiana TaxID=1069815 RepID=A0ABD3UUN3_SINWO